MTTLESYMEKCSNRRSKCYCTFTNLWVVVMVEYEEFKMTINKEDEYIVIRRYENQTEYER